MYDRCDRLGSCNSNTTWSAALSWWVKSHGGTPVYYNHPLYKEVHSTMIEMYSKPRGVRLPIRLKWIITYLISLGVTPTTWYSVSLDNLSKGFLIIMAFFSISRPSEVLFTDKTERAEWEIIATGLKFSHLRFCNMDKQYIYRYIEVTIKWFKNQTFRGVPKKIYMGVPICEDVKCSCQYLDFFAIYKVLIKRRKGIHRCLQQQDFSLLIKSERSKHRKKLKNLDTKSTNYIFVGLNGSIWRPSMSSECIVELIRVNKIPNPEFYAPYSLRIGGTSLCNQQNIDLLKVLRYVAWSIKSLPHVSARYILFTELELALIPFEMIHGRNTPGEYIKSNIDEPLTVFNPWEGDSVYKLFEED